MSDDGFNMSMRKFLKTVGVTSQQEIEAAIRAARDAGTLPDGDITITATIRMDDIGMDHTITGKIATGDVS